MKENTKHWVGDLMLLSVAMIWGLGFVAVKIGLNSGMSPFNLMALRFSIAALFLLPFTAKKFSRMTVRTWMRGGLLGLFVFLGFAFQTMGLFYTTTSKNAFLTSVNVVIVPFLAWFLTKKKVDGYSIAAAFLSLLGIGMLTLNGSLAVNIGDLLTIICAVMFAGHIAVTSLVAGHEDSESLVFIQMLTAALLSVFVALFQGEALELSLPSTMAILYLGIFSTGIAFFLQTMGQKFAHATKAAILLSTESLFGAVLAVIVFHDPLSPQIVWGCLIIFAAIIISETKLDFLKRGNRNASVETE